MAAKKKTKVRKGAGAFADQDTLRGEKNRYGNTNRGGDPAGGRAGTLMGHHPREEKAREKKLREGESASKARTAKKKAVDRTQRENELMGKFKSLGLRAKRRNP